MIFWCDRLLKDTPHCIEDICSINDIVLSGKRICIEVRFRIELSRVYSRESGSHIVRPSSIINTIICAPPSLLCTPSSRPHNNKDDFSKSPVLVSSCVSYTTQLQTFPNTYINNAKPPHTKTRPPMSHQCANFTSVSI